MVCFWKGAELKIQMEGLQADQAMYMIVPEGMTH